MCERGSKGAGGEGDVAAAVVEEDERADEVER